ncbi:MAG: hypothetical protein IH608_02705, partial [Proteobacteria bacterium]|nr:hypothetical protein [Pseudomonadota bacterium]
SVRAQVYVARKGANAFTPLTGSMKEHMNFPASLAPDDKGQLYLVDQYGSGLAIVGADGAFLGRRLDMGWSDSHLRYPSGISISPRGDAFVADKANNRVQQFAVIE